MILGITLGDPGGIGPEVTLKSLIALQPFSDTIVLFGPAALQKHPFIDDLIRKLPVITYVNSIDDLNPKTGLSWVNTSDLSEFVIGKADKENGKAASTALTAAMEAIGQKKIQALVTAPLCKESMVLGETSILDHTGFLQKVTNSNPVRMGFYSEAFSTILHTIHTPLSTVMSHLTPKELADTLKLARTFCLMLGKKQPRIAVAGLNPHAGENGIIGEEDLTLIKPAIEEAARVYPDCQFSGPHPPDTVYVHALKGQFDLVVSLYHDQGLIPLKLIAFDTAVNVTLGLPFIRTSPDHGTAFDIAYQDKANPQSMIEAIRFAQRHTYP